MKFKSILPIILGISSYLSSCSGGGGGGGAPSGGETPAMSSPSSPEGSPTTPGNTPSIQNPSGHPNLPVTSSTFNLADMYSGILTVLFYSQTNLSQIESAVSIIKKDVDGNVAVVYSYLNSNGSVFVKRMFTTISDMTDINNNKKILFPNGKTFSLSTGNFYSVEGKEINNLRATTITNNMNDISSGVFAAHNNSISLTKSNSDDTTIRKFKYAESSDSPTYYILYDLTKSVVKSCRLPFFRGEALTYDNIIKNYAYDNKGTLNSISFFSNFLPPGLGLGVYSLLYSVADDGLIVSIKGLISNTSIKISEITNNETDLANLNRCFPQNYVMNMSSMTPESINVIYATDSAKSDQQVMQAVVDAAQATAASSAQAAEEAAANAAAAQAAADEEAEAAAAAEAERAAAAAEEAERLAFNEAEARAAAEAAAAAAAQAAGTAEAERLAAEAAEAERLAAEAAEAERLAAEAAEAERLAAEAAEAERLAAEAAEAERLAAEAAEAERLAAEAAEAARLAAEAAEAERLAAEAAEAERLAAEAAEAARLAEEAAAAAAGAVVVTSNLSNSTINFGAFPANETISSLLPGMYTSNVTQSGPIMNISWPNAFKYLPQVKRYATLSFSGLGSLQVSSITPNNSLEPPFFIDTNSLSSCSGVGNNQSCNVNFIFSPKNIDTVNPDLITYPSQTQNLTITFSDNSTIVASVVLNGTKLASVDMAPTTIYISGVAQGIGAYLDLAQISYGSSNIQINCVNKATSTGIILSYTDTKVNHWGGNWYFSLGYFVGLDYDWSQSPAPPRANWFLIPDSTITPNSNTIEFLTNEVAVQLCAQYSSASPTNIPSTTR